MVMTLRMSGSSGTRIPAELMLTVTGRERAGGLEPPLAQAAARPDGASAHSSRSLA